MPHVPEPDPIHLQVSASATPEEIGRRIREAAQPAGVADTLDTLALLDRIDQMAHDLPALWQDTPLTVEQAARVEAVRSAAEILTPRGPMTRGTPGAVDVLDVAEWIVTGERAVPIELIEDVPEACILPVPEVTAEPVRVDPADVRGFGARVRAMIAGHDVTAVLADPKSGAGRWWCAGPADSRGWWGGRELSDVILLDAGEPTDDAR